MARPIPAWQYLAFGVLWVVGGAWQVVGLVQNNYSNLIFAVPFGSLLFGVGGYWLWRFPDVRRRELAGRELGPGN